MRRCVRSRNFTNEEAIARVGPQLKKKVLEKGCEVLVSVQVSDDGIQRCSLGSRRRGIGFHTSRKYVDLFTR